MMDTTEIRIEVPWGYVAAKTRGNKNDPPVLAVHGLQDNAGTFDRLLDYLPKNYYYVCIDLPSHGLSSHIPAHVVYDSIMPLISLRYVIKYFNWERFVYMAHSYGAHIGILFAFLYPHYIEKFIHLDAVTQYSVEPNYFVSYVDRIIDLYIRHEEKMKNSNPPLYTYEEAFDKLVTGRPTQLELEAARALLTRKITKHSDEKYMFSTDQRLKFYKRSELSIRYILSLVRRHRFDFPHLLLMASETVQLGFFQQYKDIIKEWKKNKYFEMYQVEGNHDMHNNTPELISKIITKFLNKKYSKI